MRGIAKNNLFSLRMKLPCLSYHSSPAVSRFLLLFQIPADSKVRKIAPITNGKPTHKNSNLEMSDVLLDLKKESTSVDFKLKVSESPFPYINQQRSLESEIAPSLYILYPILLKRHELVGIKDNRRNELDYSDLLNIWIPGQWFKLSKENGSTIQGRLGHEAGSFYWFCFKLVGKLARNFWANN